MKRIDIDLTNLCYYDKRNPDCSVDDEDIEDHKKSLSKKNKTCSCDNCFYGRTELTEQLIWQQERMYSEEDMVKFAEFVATYLDKNRNANGEMLHAKSKYDGAERTIDLLKQYKKK